MKGKYDFGATWGLHHVWTCFPIELAILISEGPRFMVSRNMGTLKWSISDWDPPLIKKMVVSRKMGTLKPSHDQNHQKNSIHVWKPPNSAWGDLVVGNPQPSLNLRGPSWRSVPEAAAAALPGPGRASGAAGAGNRWLHDEDLGFNSENHGGFHSHGGTPSCHPFLDWDFP